MPRTLQVATEKEPARPSVTPGRKQSLGEHRLREEWSLDHSGRRGRRETGAPREGVTAAD